MTTLNLSRYYHSLYAGKKILVKASGELLGEQLYKQCRELLRVGIQFILVGGGGRPITDAWEKHIHRWNVEHPSEPPRSKVRPMEKGGGITNAELMEHAVLPVYTETRSQLGQHLSDFHVLEPDQVQCARQPACGLVGEPRAIDGLDSAPNLAVLSVGMDEARTLVNINADSIARRITEQMRGAINEVIFLTGTGGVLDKDGSLVSVIFSHDMREDGTHRFPNVRGWMQQKFSEILAMLPLVGKVIVTKDLQREIESVFGSGTMFVDSLQLQCSPLQREEESVFDEVYQQNVAAKKFRPRSAEELQLVKKHHSVMRIKGSLLGGFSLMPGSRGWMELSNLWAAHLGNGMGSILTVHAKQAFTAQERCTVLYALSTASFDQQEDPVKVIRRFTGYGFGCVGLLRDAKISLKESLPSELLNYDTTKRNPYLFLMQKS